MFIYLSLEAIPMNRLSTFNYQTTVARLSAELVGVAGETVRVCAARGMTKMCQQVEFTTSGKKMANFADPVHWYPDIEIVH